MADVKWIKIVTDIFDDEKIRYIETLPNGDETIVIWFRLLCLAGKSNRNGILMMTDKIAYTDEMLSSIFARDIKAIQMALSTFNGLGMIEMIDNKIYLTNWEKHQNVDKLDQIRESTRKRVATYRQKQIGVIEDVTLQKRYSNVTVTQNVTPCNATDKELDKEIDKDKKKKITRTPSSFGQYGNVKLTEDEYQKLGNERDVYVQFLDEYIEEKGYKSKNHNLAIQRWVIKAVNERNGKGKKERVYELPKEVPDDRELSDADKQRIKEKMQSLGKE